MILTMKCLNSSRKSGKRNLPELIDAFVFWLVKILDVKKKLESESNIIQQKTTGIETLCGP